ncbi:MAG: GTP-binding protein [Clostridia bacterium]|nr:putative glycoside hydrolase [Eubacteriales bacterium]NCC47579.1 GTP-binding protein [Clostridia bacterium]
MTIFHDKRNTGMTRSRLRGSLVLAFLLITGLMISACAADTTSGGSGETTLPGVTDTGSEPSESREPSDSETDTGTSESSDSGSESSEPSESTTETTAEPTPPPQVTPALIEEPIVTDFFGPLPTASQVVPLNHLELRALYIGAAANMDQAIEIARTTEVNAVVIDLKESDGIKYESTVPLALENGLVHRAYDIQSVVDRLHAEDIKVIGRIVCFKDPLLAEKRSDLSIRDASGNRLFFNNEGGKPFVSPYNEDVWQYNIDIALEAIEYGVDEIQFDYVRFPTGSTSTGAKPYFGPEETVPSRIQAINRFLQVARVQIQDERGIPLGADVFAIILTSDLDGRNLGQDWTTVGLTGIDNVCPMIYPSHYANDSTTHYMGNGKGTVLNGVHFTKPDLHPYDVMYHALVARKEATEQEGYSVNRPYLQAFTASYLPEGYYMTYGPQQILDQIRAIEDAGFSEWICWNPRAEYSAASFRAAP